jgi:tRNA pseudouridine38-40 synthase
MRYKLTIEYDGTNFCGWQRQARDLTVQQVIEKAIHKFCGETVALHVAGRTDAGVHARGNVAHVDLIKNTDAEEILGAINFHVRPHPIVLHNVEAVTNDFHARFDAIGRRYKYYILNRRTPPALLANKVWHVKKPLDISAMQAAANMLIGHHDFSTFRAANCQGKSPMRTLNQFTITDEGECIVFDVRARSFLYHQVRNMVGTLAMVGGGQWSLADFTSAFAACDRTKGGPTAPADGLVFWEVMY